MTPADRLEAHTSSIVERSFATMYADPFWRERFGARGERYTREDHAHHVHYLAEGLRSGDTGLVASYLRWLRPVLTTRGMCTKHLEDAVLAVRDAAVAEGLDAEGQLAPHVTAARAALRYAPEDATAAARALQDRAAELAAAAGAASARPGVLEHLVSYLADAAARGEAGSFVAHVRWLAGRTPPWLDVASLEALRAAIGRLAPTATERTTPVLELARDVLAEGAR